MDLQVCKAAGKFAASVVNFSVREEEISSRVSTKNKNVELEFNNLSRVNVNCIRLNTD